MKRMEMLVKPTALESFKFAAQELGISEFEVSEVRSWPTADLRERQRLYRGQEFTVDLLPRLKLEFLVFDRDVKGLLQRVLELVDPERVAIFRVDEVLKLTAGTGHTKAAQLLDNSDNSSAVAEKSAIYQPPTFRLVDGGDKPARPRSAA
jgi:nitrogen regulatory protein P-II 1